MSIVGGASGFRWDGPREGAATGVVVAIFHAVRRLPYASTGRRTAADLVREGRGACTAKHLLLRDLLESVGVPASVETVAGRFGAGLPDDLPSMPPELRAMIGAGGVPDFHHCVTAVLDGREVVLDATWHDALIPQGFPVNHGWAGAGDTALAVEGTRLPEPPRDIAAFKAARIAELPQADRESRRRFLGLISDWISGLDADANGGEHHGTGSLRRY